MYGLGFTCRSTRYTSNGSASSVEVVALGEHDLEDVAVEDVLLGHLDGLLVEPARHRRTDRPATRPRPAAVRPARTAAAARGSRRPAATDAAAASYATSSCAADRPCVGTLSIM